MPSLDTEMLAVLRWLWSARPTPDLEARARELLLDTVGCAIAGTAEPEVAALFRGAAELDPGSVRFPGVPRGVSAAAFASAFAAAACWHEACEGLAIAHGRPGLHAIPAVLGPALARGASLGALLQAITAGYETGGRMGAVCRIRPGMHVDGTWGAFAAATATCRLLGASPDQALAALNHAACHLPFSLYWPIPAGSTARNAYAGHGAAHGAASAVAAMAGLGGPPGSMAEMLRLALAIHEPGRIPPPGEWLLPQGYLKPYPAVRHVHYGAAAAEAWHGDPATIQSVTLHTYPEALAYCGNRVPVSPIQAQFSLTWGVAHALIHGRLDPAAYSPDSLADPAVRRLETLIELRADPAMAETGSRGAVLEVTAAGTTWRARINSVPGDPATPMSPDAIRAKFSAYAAPVIGHAHADRIADRILEGGLEAPFAL